MLTERDLESPDPLRLDREIRELSTRVRRWRRRLRTGEDLDGDPFAFARLVAGRSAFQAVRAMREDDPLRHPLMRWIYRLAEQRIDGGAIAQVALERSVELHVVVEPERDKTTLARVLARALGDRPRRDAWLASYLSSASGLSVAISALWERRAEVGARMNAGSLDSIEGAGADARAAASAWLERSSDLFADAAPRSLGGLVETALAERVRDAFPRHLLPRTVIEPFRETDLFRDVDLDPGDLPEPYGAASFCRALGQVGAAWATALAPQNQPFVVAHDPYGLRCRTTGALFASLPAGEAFAKRALGLDPSRVREHRRALGRAALIETRTAALRVLLRTEALEGRRRLTEAFEGETLRALGLPLPRDAAGALFAPHADGAQRFFGMLLAALHDAALRDAHDEDWYRNPRAVERLRDEAKLSPETTTTPEELGRGADALFAALVDAIA